MSKLPKAVLDWFRENNRKAGQSRSPRKLAAIARNLKKAQAARWPKKDKTQ